MLKLILISKLGHLLIKLWIFFISFWEDLIRAKN